MDNTGSDSQMNPGYNQDFFGYSFSYSKKAKATPLRELSDGFSDPSYFHDPFSPVSLFLSKKIRGFIEKNPHLNKWSTKVAETLIPHLSKEFIAAFPKCKLNLTHIKKVWDKVFFYLRQIQEQEESLNEDGSVNIDFLVSENLKQTLILNTSFPSPSFYFAHQVAMQIAECVAVLEGRKVAVDKLSKRITYIQKHLITPPKNQTLLYSEVDKLDRLIIKIMLKITANEPLITYKDLKNKTCEVIDSLKKTGSFSSTEEIYKAVSALLAEKMSLSASLYDHFDEEEKQACEQFVKNHYKLIKEADSLASKEDILRRTLSLYKLATKLPKNLSWHNLKEAVLACYPGYVGAKPDLPQQVYAFLAAEIVLMENESFCHLQDHTIDFIDSTYKVASKLPVIPQEKFAEFEIFISKWIAEEEKTLLCLPDAIKNQIEKEIATALIDSPKTPFPELVNTILNELRSINEQISKIKEEELLSRIEDLAIQSDLLLKYTYLNAESSLLSEIRKILEDRWYFSSFESHTTFVSNFCVEYLQKFPELKIYLGELAASVWTAYKYLWYTKLSRPEESGLESFLKWHELHLKSLCKDLTEEELKDKLVQICEQRLPCIPRSFVCDWCELRTSSYKP